MQFFNEKKPISRIENEAIKMGEVTVDQIYLGGGQNDKHEFAHLLFYNYQDAKFTAAALFRKGIVEKEPNLWKPQSNHRYAADACFFRVHVSAYGNLKKEYPEIPEWDQLQKYPQPTTGCRLM